MAEPQQQEKKPKQKKEKGGGGGAAVNADHRPVFCADRERMFDELWQRQQAEFEKKGRDITVTLIDGKKKEAVAWKTTPMDIAKALSNSLAEKIILARVNRQLWDLGRPFEDDCTLELLDWESPESKHVFWHSSAHILGAAMEIMYDAQLSTGPPQPEEKGGGFFYEADTPGKVVSEGDYTALDNLVKKVTTGKHPFQRLVVSKEEALKLFGYNKFKVATLSDKVEDGTTCTVYRCGPLIDPCRGPHVHHTGRVKAIKVYNNSSSYWRNKDTNPSLQRVYGISFPKADLMKQWDEKRQAAREMDHRRTGTRQGLWMFNDLSPGSCFWYPRGTHIYNALIEFIRKEYRKRGFEEVITPNMYNKKLWETSGHWAKYSEDMFRLEAVEKDTYALKPMNCPGHCLMYASQRHSYKELPIRYGDFGVLHRNELAGALTGLTRVRRFQQDDGHVFCTKEQLVGEMARALEFVEYVYSVFGFKFHLAMSTRPEMRIGSAEIWDDAEARIERSLNMFCGLGQDGDGMIEDPYHPGEKFHYSGTDVDVKKAKKLMEDKPDCGIRYTWKINEGDGAFYGPKIDIRVEDKMGRPHQLGTVQLDFNLPKRFNLTYDDGKPAEALNYNGEDLVTPSATFFEPSEENPFVSKDGYLKSRCVKGEEAKEILIESKKARPVLIHRAILGSLERCIAILSEHWGGKWPFWVSPRQAIVIPISHNFDGYAREVKEYLYGEGFGVDMDLGDNTLDKKVREATVAQYNFILVVGEKDKEVGGATVRKRGEDGRKAKQMKRDEIIDVFNQLMRKKPQDDVIDDA